MISSKETDSSETIENEVDSNGFMDDDQTTLEIFALQRMCKNKVQQSFLNVHLDLPKCYSLLFNSDSKLSEDGEGTLEKMPNFCCEIDFIHTANALTRSELYLASEQEDTKRAKYLLSKGVNPNVKTAVNQTPLHLASERGNLMIMKLFVGANADINLKESMYGK